MNVRLETYEIFERLSVNERVGVLIDLEQAGQDISTTSSKMKNTNSVNCLD